MKYVINKCYGGFGVDKDWAKAHDISNYDIWEDNAYGVRTNADFVSAVENSEEVGGNHSVLKVINIPDEATDWELNERDGFESVTAVIDGKLVHLS